MASPSAGAPALKYRDVNTETTSPGEVKGLKIYKNTYNFERDDIETIIDNQIVNLKSNCNEYYWNFTTTGIYIIIIIFKKLLQAINYFLIVIKYIK